MRIFPGWMLATLLLVGQAGADSLDDALKRYRPLGSGRVQFQLKLPEAGYEQNSTLVFQRPDKMHYWSQAREGSQAPIVETHCWLEKRKFFVWTSQAGPEPEAPRNCYFSQVHNDGLATPPTEQPLGPANFLLLLLTGDRERFQLDPERKPEGAEFWTVDGDQLQLDPEGFLRKVVAWKEGRAVANVEVTHSKEPVRPEELTWKLPEGAQPFPSR